MQFLVKIPLIKQLIAFLKAIKLSGFGDFSLYDLLEIYVMGIVKGTLTSRAGSISYSFFTALFPFLLFILNLIPFINIFLQIENFDQSVLQFVELFLPTDTQGFFEEIVKDIQRPRGGLLSSVFFLSIFLSANGVAAIFSGFEESYHVALSRNFVRQYLYALLISLMLAFLLLVAVVFFVYFEIYILQNLQDLVPRQINLIRTGQIVFFGVWAYISVSILYYFGTIEGKSAKFLSPGALMTTFLFFLTTYLFGIYLDNFATYNQLYGSLGALLIFLLYIWINSNLLLLGFELNATLNKLKKQSKDH